MNSTTENKTLSDSESLYSLNAHYQNEIVSDLTSQIKGYHSELYLTSTIEKQGSCLSEFSLTHYESPPSIALKLQDANIKKGLLKEINYLYYVTDGQLNLWDFKKDLIQIELLEDQFKFISVVDIKKECFEESVIKGLLIGFQSKVYLYGIKIDEDKIQVLHTPYKFDCYCYENDLIASTNEGRIFLANNGDVLELKYQLKSSLFSKQTSVVNHTNYLSIITKFFDFRYKNLRGLQIDLERNTLYTLNKDTNIDIYDIKGDLFQWKATITHLSPTFLKNNQLKRAISKGIVKLNIIPKQKEDLIRLVLLTYDGTWIYLKSTDDKLINEVGNLEVSHFIIGNQDTTFKNTYYNGEYYNGMLMSCFIYEDNNKEDNIIQIKYSECASEYLNNKNVLVDQVNNEDKKSLFGIDTLVTYDIQSNFDQQERVMDFMEDKKIDNIMNINIKDYYSDNTNSQYYFYQRQIYILSNKKIYKLIKFRPIDQLKYILDNLIQLKNRNTIDLLNEENIINNKELKSFIIKYGIIETLSLCYLLLSKYPYFINNQFNKDLQLEDQHNKLNEYKPILNIILKNYQQYESLFNKSYIIVQVNGQQEKIEKKIQYLACIRGLAGILSPIFNTPLLKVNTNQNQQIVNIQFNNNITKLKFIQKSIYQFIVVLSQFSLFNSNNDNDLVQFYNNDRKLLPINQSNPLIDELIKVINRILELIEFLLLLFELNTLYLIKKLDQQSIINLSQLTFNDILNLNNNNNTEFIEFIILGLINTIKELKEAKDTDSSVLEIIRQYCPTLISENEYYVYKAMEYLNLSLTQSNKFYKLDYQSKAESTLKLNKQPLSKRKLQLIVNLYLESNQPINAIQTIINNLKLISTIMTKEGHDNNNIINSEYYKLLELPLNHLLPLLKKEDMLKREEKEKSINNNIKFQYTPQTGYTQVSSTLTEYQTVLRFIETVLMELKDDQLYDYIYEYYIQNGLAYLLFDFKNEYLEKYLASSKVTANGQPILEVYYEYNQDYLKLTKLYTEKAMSNLESLDSYERMKLLIKADNSAHKIHKNEEESFKYEWLHKINHGVKMINFQRILQGEIRTKENEQIDKYQNIIDRLNQRYYSIDEMTHELDNFNNYIKLQIIYKLAFGNIFNEIEAEKLWRNLFNQINKNETFEEAETIMKELKSIFEYVSKPLNHIHLKPIIQLFLCEFSNITSVNLEWIIQHLIEFGFKNNDLLLGLKSMLKNQFQLNLNSKNNILNINILKAIHSIIMYMKNNYELEKEIGFVTPYLYNIQPQNSIEKDYLQELIQHLPLSARKAKSFSTALEDNKKQQELSTYRHQLINYGKRYNEHLTPINLLEEKYGEIVREEMKRENLENCKQRKRILNLENKEEFINEWKRNRSDKNSYQVGLPPNNFTFNKESSTLE